MGKATVQENFAFHYGTEDEKKAAKKQMLSVFCVNTLDWKRSIVKRGVAAIIEAIDYLREQSNTHREEEKLNEVNNLTEQNPEPSRDR